MRKHSKYDETLYPRVNGKVYREWNSDGEEIEYVTYDSYFNGDKMTFYRYCFKSKSKKGISKYKYCGEIFQMDIIKK